MYAHLTSQTMNIRLYLLMIHGSLIFKRLNKLMPIRAAIRILLKGVKNSCFRIPWGRGGGGGASATCCTLQYI